MPGYLSPPIATPSAMPSNCNEIILTNSLNNPPDLVTNPADPGVYSFVLIILLIVPPIFPVLNAPGVIAPIVAGPIMVFLAS